MADTIDNTSMVLADDGIDSVSEEQKSGFASSLGNVDVLRQLTLVMALAICLAIAC